MAWQGSKLIWIIPDQQGRGGSKTSLTTQSINLDIRLAKNVFVNYGRWARAPKAIAAPAYPAISDVLQSYALHSYVRFDTSNAALLPINALLSHNQKTNGDQEIDRHGLGAVKTHTPPGGVNDTVPATFQNIKNRCFMCWGGTLNFIYDGVVTYDVGIEQPATAATYVLGDILKPYVFATAGGNRISILNLADPITNAVTFVSIGGTTYPTLQPTPIDSGPFAAPGTASGTSGTFTLTVNGGGTPWPNRDYNGLIVTVDGFPYFIKDYTIVGSTMTVTLFTALATSPSTASYTITGKQIVLTTPYTGATTTVVTDTGFGLFTSDTVATVFEGPLSWDTVAPIYAYAYYDLPFAEIVGTATGNLGDTVLTINGAHWPPTRYEGMTITITATGESHKIVSYADSGPDTTVLLNGSLGGTFVASAYTMSGPMKCYGTGHISNGSPQTMVTEQNQGGVAVVLDDIMPSRVEDQARFNKIQIFRTLITGGGGILFPLDPVVGLLDNVGTAPLSFTDPFDDSYLLTVGGFQMPLTSNRKPPAFAHQANWDSRVFGVPVDNPTVLRYSGNSQEILFGVPEECYDSLNLIPIPSDDGRCTGMRLMGPLLVVSTERYAYYVTSTGAAGPNAYRLVRFSTLMQGVGDYQMAEFAGATTDDSDLLMYVGKDKKFYLTAPGVGNVSVSDPIQDAFTNGIGAGYNAVRLVNIAIQGNHYLIVNVGQDVNAVAYDWDRKIWLHHFIQSGNLSFPHIDAFCTVYGTAQPVQFLFLVDGVVFEWLGPNNTEGVGGAFVQTAPLSGDRKSRHRVQEVRLYVSDAPVNNGWSVEISVDELPPTLHPAIEMPDQLNTIQPPGSVPIDALTAKEIVVFPSANPVDRQDGYRFWFKPNWPGDTGMQELYAIAIVLADLEPPPQENVSV